MEKEVIIETVDLKKVYGEGDAEVTAVNGISIRIRSGEFVAIMGPSGSGKSTLMNILACLDRPTEGQYILAGEDVSEYSRKELAHVRSQLLGFVFQSFNLLPRASALENVMMPHDLPARKSGIARLNGRSLPCKPWRAWAWKTGCTICPASFPAGSSSAWRLPASLVNDPVLILADEPTGNLDTKSSEEILGLLHELHERGRTIVMVTHEPDVAHHTERILTIRDGKLYSDQMNGKSVTWQNATGIDYAVEEKGKTQ